MFLKCTGGDATMKVTGPGTTEGTSSLAADTNPAATFVNGQVRSARGSEYVVGPTGSRASTSSSATVDDVRDQDGGDRVNPGLFTQCRLSGAAIPVSSSPRGDDQCPAAGEQ